MNFNLIFWEIGIDRFVNKKVTSWIYFSGQNSGDYVRDGLGWQRGWKQDRVEKLLSQSRGRMMRVQAKPVALGMQRKGSI